MLLKTAMLWFNNLRTLLVDMISAKNLAAHNDVLKISKDDIASDGLAADKNPIANMDAVTISGCVKYLLSVNTIIFSLVLGMFKSSRLMIGLKILMSVILEQR